MPTWYSIRKRGVIAAAALAAAAGAAAPVAAAEILIYGEIGESWWSDSVSAGSFVRELQALDAAEITVRINSIGGSVPDGIAIHNALKRHPAQITTIVDGMALSIASLIACGGDVVQMAENATFMVHAPWTLAAGNAVELREAADMLDTWAAAMSTSYAAKTGQSAADSLALLSDGKDHWYTAAEAKAAGFCDEVVSAAPVAAMASLDLSRFRDVPEALHPFIQSAASAASRAAGAANSQERSTMPTTNTPATPTNDAAQQQQVEAARREGAQAESQRTNDIRAAFKPFAGRDGMDALLEACLTDATVSAAAANQRILAQLAKGAEPAGGSHVVTLEDERDKRVAAASAALMARAGVLGADRKRVRVDASNPYRGHSLLDLARAALSRAGIKHDGMDKMTLVAAAFTQSTSDFPVLLENTMHKTLQAAYGAAPDTWSRFCKQGSVSDFREHPRMRVGGLSNLETVNELGEFKNKTIPDGEKGVVQAATKGNIINLSRKAIINDDLNAFVGLAAALGRAARRSIEADVYTLLGTASGLGPNLEDGVALFNAAHSNIAATGGAPTVTTFDAARQLMASQLDVNGVEYLDLRPAIFVGPLSVEGAAKVVNDSQYDPDANNKLQRANISRGMVTDIVGTPRLSGTRWYMFADPNDAPVIEVSFLDGNSEPFLEMEQGFDVDGSRWKVRIDYGVDAVDFRGAITNAGA
jgi:ATP-dependent protease ClpP protease subunit